MDIHEELSNTILLIATERDFYLKDVDNLCSRAIGLQGDYPSLNLDDELVKWQEKAIDLYADGELSDHEYNKIMQNLENRKSKPEKL